MSRSACAQAPAGQGVVADVGHALVAQRLAADREQAIAHGAGTHEYTPCAIT